jgi:hypothetical protein
MQEISDKAKAQGPTPEILNSLLIERVRTGLSLIQTSSSVPHLI